MLERVCITLVVLVLEFAILAALFAVLGGIDEPHTDTEYAAVLAFYFASGWFVAKGGLLDD